MRRLFGQARLLVVLTCGEVEVEADPGARETLDRTRLAVADESSPVGRLVPGGVEAGDGSDPFDRGRALRDQPSGSERRIADERGFDVPPLDDRRARRQDLRHLGAREVTHLDHLEVTGDTHLIPDDIEGFDA
jgi:hypothetical protein